MDVEKMEQQTSRVRFEEAKRGFLGALAAWQAFTPSGRVQFNAQREWEAENMHLQETSVVTDAQLLAAMDRSPIRMKAGASWVLTSEEAVNVAMAVIHKANAARQELSRRPPKPVIKPVNDNSSFYQSFLVAHAEFELALKALALENPNFDRDLARNEVLYKAGML